MNRLDVDLSRNYFRFERERLVLSTREGAEGVLVVEYEVSQDRARQIISQAGVFGSINLSVAIPERKERNGQEK